MDSIYYSVAVDEEEASLVNRGDLNQIYGSEISSSLPSLSPPSPSRVRYSGFGKGEPNLLSFFFSNQFGSGVRLLAGIHPNPSFLLFYFCFFFFISRSGLPLWGYRVERWYMTHNRHTHVTFPRHISWP